MAERTNAPIRLVLAYDGSDVAADAIRAAGTLFPGANAIVVHHRDEPDAPAHASLARIALPDTVTIEAVREYERSRDGAGLGAGRARPGDRAACRPARELRGAVVGLRMAGRRQRR